MPYTSFDSDGHLRLKKDVVAIEEAAGHLYNEVRNGGIASFTKYDSTGLTEQLQAKTTEFCKRLTDLVLKLEEYRIMAETVQKENLSRINGLGEVYYDCPFFSDIVVSPITDIYTNYKSYQFMQSGHSFSSDFNDAYSFMQSDLYKTQSSFKTGLSEVSNYKLLFQYFTGNLDEYTDDMLKSSMQEILNTLPDAGETDFSITDSLTEKIESITGIENFDKWYDELLLLMKQAAKNGKTGTFFTSPEYLEWLDSIGESSLVVHEILTSFISEEMWSSISDAAELAGDIGDILEWGDLLSDTIKRSVIDYSTQIGYLNSMQDMMLDAGFYYGSVHTIINELREEYNDAAIHALRALGEKVSKEAIKGGATALSNCNVLVKNVNLGLKIISTTSKAFYADEISADKTLMGLVQYDQVLTRSYEKYLGMVTDGVATENEMRKLDQVFTLLASTKKKEYESMMTLSKGTELYEVYQSKAAELEDWLQNVPDFGAYIP